MNRKNEDVHTGVDHDISVDFGWIVSTKIYSSWFLSDSFYPQFSPFFILLRRNNNIFVTEWISFIRDNFGSTIQKEYRGECENLEFLTIELEFPESHIPYIPVDSDVQTCSE
jgi:hypothetical protein